jgi:hypothetical protein
MKTLLQGLFAHVSRGLRPVDERRSWMAGAIINSIGVRSRGAENGDRRWQCTRAPAFVRIFRRTRRYDRSSIKTLLYAGALATMCVAVFWPAQSNAQARCGEGRTSAGQCVDAALAGAMRQVAIIFSQPKISYTAYPVMPSADVRVRYPHQLNPDPLKPSSIGTLAPN